MSDDLQDTKEKETDGVVHYTTAVAALSILSSQTFWMKQASQMNDTQEMKVTLDRLSYIRFLKQSRETLNTLLKKETEPFSFEELDNSINTAKKLSEYVYLTSFSKETRYEQECENYRGRLSMWRSYGARDGVALVFKNSFINDYDLQEVTYVDPSDERDFLEISINRRALDDYIQLIKNTENPNSSRSLCSLKHKGFEEEHEYRKICKINSDNENNSHDKKKVQLFRFKLEYLKRIIIGPSLLQDEIENYFIEFLSSKPEFVTSASEALQKEIEDFHSFSWFSPKLKKRIIEKIIKSIQDELKSFAKECSSIEEFVEKVVRSIESIESIESICEYEKEHFLSDRTELNQLLRAIPEESKEALQICDRRMANEFFNQAIKRYKEERKKDCAKAIVRYYIHKSDIPLR